RHLGLRGAMIDPNALGRPLGDRAFDPFWAVAAELAAPVVLHPFLLEAVERFGPHYLHNLVGYPFETTLAAGSLILGGTLDRFPGLDVVLVHGGGFLPYHIGRFDRAHTTRKEAPRLLTGRGKFAADFRLPGMLQAAVLRSPHAHARLGEIRSKAALTLPGVVAVVTGEDLGTIGRIPTRLGHPIGNPECLQR